MFQANHGEARARGLEFIVKSSLIGLVQMVAIKASCRLGTLISGHDPPNAADVVGVVSLIFWALMVMVSLKYVVFVLRADNDGEGGILALLSLVAFERVANGPRIPILVLLGIVGASLLYGDGVITPAISVLSAMEGLKLVTPAFDQ